MRRRLVTLLAALTLLGATGCLPALDGSNTGPSWDGSSHTETNPTVCNTTASGTYTVTTSGTSFSDMHVVDGLCVNGGTLVIDADYVRIVNSEVHAAPPGDFAGVYVVAGHHGIQVTDSIIDCGTPSTGTPVASHGIQAETGLKTGAPSTPGLYLDVQRNEIRDCSDGVILPSYSYIGHNLIHQPDNTDDTHADGFQWSTEDDATTGISHSVVEWNRINFPDASSAFQYHNRPEDTDGSEWPLDIIVRYNWFEGGAYVVRFPGRNCSVEVCSGTALQFYGNRVNMLTDNEFGLCDGNTDSVAVWGEETGGQADSLPQGNPDGVKDDANIDHEAGYNVRLERSCDGIN